MMDMPITIYSIDGMHLAFTETGENGSIQRQLITPPTRICCEHASADETQAVARQQQRTPGATPTHVECSAQAECASDHQQTAKEKVAGLDPAQVAIGEQAQIMTRDVEAWSEQRLRQAQADIDGTRERARGEEGAIETDAG